MFLRSVDFAKWPTVSIWRLVPLLIVMTSCSDSTTGPPFLDFQLAGRVVDLTDQPVEGIRVHLQHNSLRCYPVPDCWVTIEIDTTDIDGKFSFRWSSNQRKFRLMAVSPDWKFSYTYWQPKDGGWIKFTFVPLANLPLLPTARGAARVK